MEDLQKLAQEYLKTITILQNKIEQLEDERAKTKGLEFKRKIQEKIIIYNSVLRQNQKTYAYLINYDNKDYHLGW